MENGKKRHFLFHVFRLDKEENPMPPRQAENMLEKLKKLFANTEEK